MWAPPESGSQDEHQPKGLSVVSANSNSSCMELSKEKIAEWYNHAVKPVLVQWWFTFNMHIGGWC